MRKICRYLWGRVARWWDERPWLHDYGPNAIRRLIWFLCVRCPRCGSHEHVRNCTERSDLPQARLVDALWMPRPLRTHSSETCQCVGWCHEADEYPPPCCPECRAFGPCADCLRRRSPRDCGDTRCAPCHLTYRGSDSIRDHFDSSTKSCYEHGCTDDCPIGGKRESVGP